MEQDRADIDDVGAALDPRQDEQVLDHPLEPLGLAGDLA